jgi:hypothetical protein
LWTSVAFLASIVLTIALSIPERMKILGSWEDDHDC